MTKSVATLTSKGQITIPADLRKRWNLKPGDKIAFEAEADRATITPQRRRSIFERLDELSLPPIGRPLKQSDIDDAIAAEVTERHARLKDKGRKA